MDNLVQNQRRRVKLPHIPRLFTATIFPGTANFALWALLTSLVSLNILTAVSKPSIHQEVFLNIFARPFSSLTHERMAITLWDGGSRKQAIEELRLATDLTHDPQIESSSQVLGASTTPADLLHTWEQVPMREAAEFAYWQTVAASHPDYRDAFVQMATISYAQGNLIGAKTYLTEASMLEPNSTAIHELLEFVTKQLGK